MDMQKKDLGTLRGRCSDVIHTEMTRLEQTCEPLMMGSGVLTQEGLQDDGVEGKGAREQRMSQGGWGGRRGAASQKPQQEGIGTKTKWSE